MLAFCCYKYLLKFLSKILNILKDDIQGSGEIQRMNDWSLLLVLRSPVYNSGELLSRD